MHAEEKGNLEIFANCLAYNVLALPRTLFLRINRMNAGTNLARTIFVHMLHADAVNGYLKLAPFSQNHNIFIANNIHCVYATNEFNGKT